MFRVYLAGHMSKSELEKTIVWRKEIRSYYVNKDWDIVWLDPYNGKCLESISNDGLKSSVPPHAILHRDYKCVQDADLIVANMDTFGSNRSPCGTISELAWAWQMRKPIIMITKDKNYIDHPFMSEFASWIVPDLDTLLKEKVINYFYKGKVSAKY